MSTTTTYSVKDAVAHAQKIANGQNEQVRPGQPFTFSEGCSEGDMVWQGDLGVGICKEGPPQGYVKLDNPVTQLVPGDNSTQGSRHCLASTEGVTMWVPETWNEEALDGPYLELQNGATITHPIHGDVTIPASFKNVQVVYQKEWDKSVLVICGRNCRGLAWPESFGRDGRGGFCRSLFEE